jgi:DNA-binding MarR family transcriptional regulator
VDSFEKLGFLLDDTARLYARRFREQSHELSLEPAHCRALLVLADNPGISQTALADLCGLNGAYMTRVVDLLELCGWAERHPHPHDRRTHVLSVTSNAAPVLDRISSIIGEALLQALQNLSAEEIRALLRLLGKLRANLSGPEPVAASAAKEWILLTRRALPSER